ncbi:conserved hypothetical protein [Methanosalsum zhilinae DSM 4017]|uniref:Uncharacterized protein n=1 Tax=Methanosalsum zhilinae (strain DSM 4017 / NBRC 107636 / OCM 62 / WeN5) TaxID=679901 RepID=F7XNZ1_METZD|nr:hypothetical protein [Methanosalsum zhilinae]AEH60181.1 conserved hypothetical protein [Methanosalsum zhilinae DSM 4017]
MYIYIALAAYMVVLFLTLRDIRIYKRTGFQSYRKGAMKGIGASFIVLIGAIISLLNPNIGLLLVLIGLFLNKKGVREKVFEDANTLDRFLGKTDYKKENWDKD